jgi:hypothetical protein
MALAISRLSASLAQSLDKSSNMTSNAESWRFAPIQRSAARSNGTVWDRRTCLNHKLEEQIKSSSRPTCRSGIRRCNKQNRPGLPAALCRTNGVGNDWRIGRLIDAYRCFSTDWPYRAHKAHECATAEDLITGAARGCCFWTHPMAGFCVRYRMPGDPAFCRQSAARCTQLASGIADPHLKEASRMLPNYGSGWLTK